MSSRKSELLAGWVIGAIVMLPSCGPRDATDTTLLLGFENAGDAPIPDELRLSIYDDSGRLFDNRRLPEQGSLVPSAPPRLGEVLVYPRDTVGPLRLYVRGFRGRAQVSEGAKKDIVLRPRAVTRADVTLSAAVLPDADMDGVPDEIDNCPAANPEQAMCGAQDAPRPVADAAAEPLHADAEPSSERGLPPDAASDLVIDASADQTSPLDAPTPDRDAAADAQAADMSTDVATDPGTGSDAGDAVDLAPDAPPDGPLDQPPADRSPDTASLANGSPCMSGSECVSGACVDGVCCAQALCSVCFSCAAPSPGMCGALPDFVDDDNPPGACAGSRTCDGVGGCKRKTGQPCNNGSECASGFCADAVCCNRPCGGACERCNTSPGTCTTVPAGTDPDAECGFYTCNGGTACYDACEGTCSSKCAADAFCSGGSCMRARPAGGVCTAGCQCLSGMCGALLLCN